MTTLFGVSWKYLQGVLGAHGADHVGLGQALTVALAGDEGAVQRLDDLGDGDGREHRARDERPVALDVVLGQEAGVLVLDERQTGLGHHVEEDAQEVLLEGVLDVDDVVEQARAGELGDEQRAEMRARPPPRRRWCAGTVPARSRRAPRRRRCPCRRGCARRRVLTRAIASTSVPLRTSCRASSSRTTGQMSVRSSSSSRSSATNSASSSSSTPSACAASVPTGLK